MSKGGADEGAAPHAPWAFDPMATARVLGEIQAEGLRAAGALVDRLVHLVDGPVSVDEHAEDVASLTPNSAADGQAAAEAWFTMWSELFERTTAALGSFGGGTVDRSGGEDTADLTLTGRRPADGEAVSLRIAAGATGSTEVWLHNGTADDLGPLTPICSPLLGPTGAPLAGAVAVDPPAIEQLPRRSSRGLLVTVRVATESVAGPYRGTLQVAGAPDLWLPVTVVVDEPA